MRSENEEVGVGPKYDGTRTKRRKHERGKSRDGGSQLNWNQNKKGKHESRERRGWAGRS